jgi:hypothetical protein
MLIYRRGREYTEIFHFKLSFRVLRASAVRYSEISLKVVRYFYSARSDLIFYTSRSSIQESISGCQAQELNNTSRFLLYLFFLLNPESKTSSCCLVPTAYLITRSARASTFGGIVRPICFAVFKLITNWNLLGRSTGRSPGLVPFNILST